MRCYVLNKKTKQLHTHNQPSSILELHSVIVNSDFQLLRSTIMWPMLFTAVTAVFIIVIIIVFFTAPILAVAIVIIAAAIDALDVDFWEVCWQIPGKNEHIWVLSFIVVFQSVEGSIVSLSVPVSFYFTLIEACGATRENQKSVSLLTHEPVLIISIFCTCCLAIVIALVIWKANSIVTAFFLVFAFNHSSVLSSFAFTLLPAVTCVPLFIELQRKKMQLQLGLQNARTNTQLSMKALWLKISRETSLLLRTFLWKYSHTWYFLPLLSTHPHCWIGTQILPLHTNPLSHAHPSVQGWLSLQTGGPFRCSQVGPQAGRQVV